MKTVTTILLLLTMSIYTIAAEVSDEFLDRIATIESGVDDSAINKSECAHGRYQIRAGYLADANRILGSCYDLWDMHDPVIARIVVTAYLKHYGLAYERRTGQPVTAEVLARIHNGGPRGAEKNATLPYLAKFVGVAMEGTK